MTKRTKGIIAAVTATIVAFTAYVVVERRKNTKKEDTPTEEEAR